MASRREADDWISRRAGSRSTAGGRTWACRSRPMRASRSTQQAQGQQANQVTILINKPMGLRRSGQAEDGHQPAITLVQPQNRWAEDNARFFFHPAQLQKPGAGRPAGHRLHRPAGADPGWSRRAPAHWRRLGDGKGIPGSRGLHRQGHGSGRHSRRERHPTRAIATQLSRIDDNDPVSGDVQRVPADKLALLRHGLSLDGQALKPAPGGMAEPGAIALCPDGRQGAPDPAHVRTGGAESGGPQAGAHGPCDAGEFQNPKTPWLICL